MNRQIAQDLFNQIKDGEGFAVFHTQEPDRIIYILRSALKTEFKEWDGLITLRKKEDRVVVKPSVPSLTSGNIPKSSLRTLLEIASFIVTNNPKIMSFPDAQLGADDSEKLKKICNVNFYEVTFDPLTIKKQ